VDISIANLIGYIGKSLPWDELLSFCDKDSKELKWAISSVYYDGHGWGWNNRYSRQTFNPEEYFLDEKGIVLAYGEEAIRLNQDREFYRQNQQFINRCNTCYHEFKENFEFFETLALFDTEKDEAKKDVYAEKLCTLLESRLPTYLAYIDNGHSPGLLRNQYVGEIKETYDNSLTKKHFISSADAEV
jgi:hypothetical protein